MNAHRLLLIISLVLAGCSDDSSSSVLDLGPSPDSAQQNDSQAGDQTLSDGGAVDSTPQNDGVTPDSAAPDSDTADGATPADSGLDSATSDTSVDGATSDTSVDGATSDTSVDSATSDTSVDSAAPDTSVDSSAPDTSVDSSAPDSTVDTVSASSWLDNTLADFPATITALGLFPNPSDRTRADGRLHYFEPRYPLWTDGSDKGRWLFLPAGQTIDNTTRAWVFPNGAVLFKHFEYPGQAVETRVMRKRGGSWEYATYQWNSAGDEANLLDGNNAVAVTITGRPELDYFIPSTAQCAECHDVNNQRVGNTDVLVPIVGFDELRLNHTLSGASQTQIAAFAAQGLFSNALPATLDAISGSAAAVAAKGWIHGNCAHCHNPLKFDARHSEIEVSAISAPKNFPFIVPQDAEGSRIFVAAVRWNNTLNVSQMPRLGVSLPDPAAEQTLIDWINSLPLP